MPKKANLELAIAHNAVYLPPRKEKALLNRLSRIEGHVRGIKKMLEEHKSCDDVLVQMGAVKSALTNAMLELLNSHLESCVLERVEAGEGREALEALRSSVSAAIKNV